MLIKACLNGSCSPGEHPALPVTPAELAREAQLAVAAGARALHIHPRRADGTQSLAAQDQAAAIAAIRASCPGVPLGVSTANWIEPDVQQRLRAIEEWTVLPDFASVNFSEPGTIDLCMLLFSRGIGVEAGISDVSDACLLHDSGLAERCLRVLLEPMEQEIAQALAAVEAVIHCLDEGGIVLPRLLHGYNATAWPVLNVALQLGYDTRIGLEDTLTLPDGTMARNNAEMVALVRSMLQQQP